jgi:hypothetical protein
MQRKHVRGLFAIHIETLSNWERNVGIPMVRHFPAIIRFLGYVPFGHDGTPGGRISFLRKCVGLTQVETARLTCVGCVNIWRYEKNLCPPDKRFRKLWKQLVGVAKKVQLWPQISREVQLG